MRWLVAILGALLIFVGVFLVSGLALAMIFPQALKYNVGVGSLSTNNPVGLALGALAAAQSFRASLRRRAAKAKTGRGELDGQAHKRHGSRGS